MVVPNLGFGLVMPKKAKYDIDLDKAMKDLAKESDTLILTDTIRILRQSVIDEEKSSDAKSQTTIAEDFKSRGVKIGSGGVAAWETGNKVHDKKEKKIRNALKEIFGLEVKELTDKELKKSSKEDKQKAAKIADIVDIIDSVPNISREKENHALQNVDKYLFNETKFKDSVKLLEGDDDHKAKGYDLNKAEMFKLLRKSITRTTKDTAIEHPLAAESVPKVLFKSGIDIDFKTYRSLESSNKEDLKPELVELRDRIINTLGKKFSIDDEILENVKSAPNITPKKQKSADLEKQSSDSKNTPAKILEIQEIGNNLAKIRSRIIQDKERREEDRVLSDEKKAELKGILSDLDEIRDEKPREFSNRAKELIADCKDCGLIDKEKQSERSR